MTTTPRVGQILTAETATPTAQRVLIEVTAVEDEGPNGWMVYGYRQTRRRAGRRQTMYPRLYFVPRD